VVSLQMFSLILERGVSLLKAQLETGQEPRLVVGEDLQVLLPAIKVSRLTQRSSDCVLRRRSPGGSISESRFRLPDRVHRARSHVAG